MITARKLVTDALIKCGAIGLTSTLDDNELMFAIDELNSLLSSYNDMTFKTEEITFQTKQSLTIGDNGWTKVAEIVDDGIECLIKCNVRHNIKGNKIYFGDQIKTILESTEKTVTIAPINLPDYDSDVSEVYTVGEVGPNVYRFLFNAPHSFNNGDVVIASNSNNYSIIGDVNVFNTVSIDVIGDLKGSISGIVGFKGKVFPYAKRIKTVHDVTHIASNLTMKPDVISSIPMEVMEMIDVNSNILYHITGQTNLQDYYYNMDNGYPVTTFKFKRDGITLKMKYKVGIGFLHPEDVINAPPYIITFLRAKLASILAPIYNQDPTHLQLEADRCYGVYINRVAGNFNAPEIHDRRSSFERGDYRWRN